MAKIIRMSFKTSLKTEEIIDSAEQFFRNVGLKVKEKGYCCINFEGGGGYINVTISNNDATEVELVGREWEYQIKKFAEKYSK